MNTKPESFVKDLPTSFQMGNNNSSQQHDSNGITRKMEYNNTVMYYYPLILTKTKTHSIFKDFLVNYIYHQRYMGTTAAGHEKG